MVDNLTSPLTPEYEKILRDRWSTAGTLVTIQINENEWTIRGNECDTMVDMLLMTCTCKQFDWEKLPCVHAVKATSVIGSDIYYEWHSILSNNELIPPFVSVMLF